MTELIILAIMSARLFLPYRSVDTDLQPYFDSYMSAVTTICKENQYYQPRRIIIKFDKLTRPTIGRCSSGLMDYTIQGDREYWKSANEEDRAELMFHELAHCVIDQDHSEDMLNYMSPEKMYDIDMHTLVKQVGFDIAIHCMSSKE